MWDNIGRNTPFQTIAVALALTAFAGLAAYQKLTPRTSNPYPREVLSLPVAPLQDFNGKTREELLQLRQSHYDGVASLKGEYRAGESETLAQVNPAWPWIGIDGIARCDRDGYKVHYREGPSLLSGIWLNPHLPVLIQPSKFELSIKDAGASELAADVLPAEASLDGPRRQLTVTYRMGRLLAQHARESHTPHLYLATINARDLGFTRFAVQSVTGLRNLKVGHADHPDGTLMPIDQDLRVLTAGGVKANQVYLRTDSFVNYDLQRLPARLEISLWKGEPENAKTPADLTEVILLDGPAQEL